MILKLLMFSLTQLRFQTTISKLVSCWNTLTLEPEQLKQLELSQPMFLESVTQNIFLTKFMLSRLMTRQSD